MYMPPPPPRRVTVRGAEQPSRVAHKAKTVLARGAPRTLLTSLWHPRPKPSWPCVPQGRNGSSPVCHKAKRVIAPLPQGQLTAPACRADPGVSRMSGGLRLLRMRSSYRDVGGAARRILTHREIVKKAVTC